MSDTQMYAKYVQQDATIAFLFSAMALLYMFRATILTHHRHWLMLWDHHDCWI